MPFERRLTSASRAKASTRTRCQPALDVTPRAGLAFVGEEPPGRSKSGSSRSATKPGGGRLVEGCVARADLRTAVALAARGIEPAGPAAPLLDPSDVATIRAP